MSILLLANTIAQNAVQLVATDTSDVAVTIQGNTNSAKGTSRHLAWGSDSTADRRLVYVNKNGTLGCTHCVLARADRHLTHQIKIRSWTAYTATATNDYTSAASFADTLIGPDSTDWVQAVSLSNKQAIGMEFDAGTGGNYMKYVHALYFSNAITFNYPESVTIAPLPLWSRTQIRHQSYMTDEQHTYSFNSLTRAEVLAFEQTYRLKENPVFLYDSAGTLIPSKLAHGFVVDYIVTRQFHDIYKIDLQFVTLRRWT